MNIASAYEVQALHNGQAGGGVHGVLFDKVEQCLAEANENILPGCHGLAGVPHPQAVEQVRCRAGPHQ